MKKYYLTLILSDTENAVGITSTSDHKAVGPIEYVMGGPKISMFRIIWSLFNLKYLLEDAYKRLEDKSNET